MKSFYNIKNRTELAARISAYEKIKKQDFNFTYSFYFSFNNKIYCKYKESNRKIFHSCLNDLGTFFLCNSNKEHKILYQLNFIKNITFTDLFLNK